jgi:hypothetical protein
MEASSIKCAECGSQEMVWFGGLCKECNELRERGGLSLQKVAAKKEEEEGIYQAKVQKQAEKIWKWGKESISVIFGILAILWFVVMLPAQPDFEGIVIGWVIIGGIYLVFRSFINR